MDFLFPFFKTGQKNFHPLENVLELLTGKVCLRAHVHKIDDIAALLRLVDDFKLRITVEHAMDVHRLVFPNSRLSSWSAEKMPKF